MFEKYTRPEMGAIWSQENKYRTWLAVEVAVAEAWAEQGRVPAGALPDIRAASVDAARIAQIEDETRHDMIAFLRNLAERVGPSARWIHLGLTSSDVVDSGLALQLVESIALLERDLAALGEVLKEMALRYRDTVMMGRTHNVHAEPITFGYKVAVWYAEVERHRARLRTVRRSVAVAKIGGAVGTHVEVPPEVEERAAGMLGLEPEPAATQVIPRDRHAEYVLELALLASSLDKIASELRNLQHSEIGEVEEGFAAGQQGSSAMPHKRNPILSERISGLSRVMRGFAVPGLENVVLWHERDISNSSVERIVLPDSSILADYMIDLLTSVLRNLQVNEDCMKQNVAASQGLYFSERVLTALIDAGLSRPEAYGLVQSAANRTRQTREPFQQVVRSDSAIGERLSPVTLDETFDERSFLRHIDAAYYRLGLRAT
ncbi:MAG: adenylosuccinate lyase [Chloroflexota bacterium]